jgi:hypothetical protein
MPDGTQTTSPKACRRCPECGHDAASKKPCRLGFWHDPTRWMVAVFAVLLIVFQFSTAWMLPKWTWSNSAANRYEVLNEYFAPYKLLSWEDISRAAERPGAERTRLIDALRRWETWHLIDECDPAASIIVADGWVSSSSTFDLSDTTEAYGFPQTCILLQDFYGEPSKPYAPYGALWFSWMSSPSLGMWTQCQPWPGGIALIALPVFVVVWLASRACRPVRAGFQRHPFARWWYWIAGAVSLVLACIPTGPVLTSEDGITRYSLGWNDNPGYTADSGLRLEDIQVAAISEASAVAFARRLLTAHGTLTRDAQQ